MSWQLDINSCQYLNPKKKKKRQTHVNINFSRCQLMQQKILISAGEDTSALLTCCSLNMKK